MNPQHRVVMNNEDGKNNNKTRMIAPLPCGFAPGPFDVVCARGAMVKKHVGNQLFRKMIKESVHAYANARSKISKSLVVSDVVDFFRERSPGGFVREQDGVWHAVSENLAREKVGQAFREHLSHQYRSSTKAKRRRWKQAEQKQAEKALSSSNNPQVAVDSDDSDDSYLEPRLDYSELISSSEEVIVRVNMLLKQLEQASAMGEDSDEKLITMFTEHNLGLLQLFQTDDSIRTKVSSNSSTTSIMTNKEE